MKCALLKVAILGDNTHKGPKSLRTILQSQPGIDVSVLGPSEIASSLSAFEVLVVPGGSASHLSSCLGSEGRLCIRNFVEAGGGYIGICAGAFLAAKYHVPYPSWKREGLGLNILKAATVHAANPIGFQGRHRKAAVELSPAALKSLEISPCSTATVVNIRFQGGPLFCPPSAKLQAEEEHRQRVCATTTRTECEVLLPPYEPWGLFVSRTGKEDINFLGASAIASSTYGAGKVLCISPHPETLPEDITSQDRDDFDFELLHKLVLNAVIYCRSAASGSTSNGGEETQQAENLKQRQQLLPKHLVRKIEKLEAKIQMYEGRLAQGGLRAVDDPDVAGLESCRLSLATIRSSGETK